MTQPQSPPPNNLQQALQRLEKTILELVEIKSTLLNAVQLQQTTVKALTDMVALNDPRVDEVLAAAQLVLTGPSGEQLFPRKSPQPPQLVIEPWKSN